MRGGIHLPIRSNRLQSSLSYPWTQYLDLSVKGERRRKNAASLPLSSDRSPETKKRDGLAESNLSSAFLRETAVPQTSRCCLHGHLTFNHLSACLIGYVVISCHDLSCPINSKHIPLSSGMGTDRTCRSHTPVRLYASSTRALHDSINGRDHTKDERMAPISSQQTKSKKKEREKKLKQASSVSQVDKQGNTIIDAFTDTLLSTGNCS
jgi:hypothetical protein